MQGKTALLVFRFGLFLVLLAPFLVSKQLLFPFVTTKSFVFRIVVELLLPVYAYLVCVRKDLRPSFKNPLTLAVVGFLIFNFISAIFGVNVIRSLWGNFERMGGAFYLLHLTLLYFYILLIAQAKVINLAKFLKVAVISASILSLYGILVALGLKPFVPDPSLPRISITFGNPIYVGSFLILPLFLSLFFILQSEKKYQKVFFGLCALVQLLAIYQSGTRGAVVGLILGGFISSVLYLFFTQNKKLKFYGSIVVGVIVLVSGLLYLNSDKLPTGSTLKRVFQLNDTNTQARLVQWKVALTGFKDRPFLGTGPENYYIVSNKYFNPEIYNYDRSWFDKPHNFLLEILITTGVLGFVFYVSIIFLSFYAVYLGFKNGFLSLAEGTLLFAGMLSYQIQNLFVFDSVPSSLMFYIYVAFCGYLFFEVKNPAEKSKEKKNAGLENNLSLAISVVVFLISVYSLYAANVAPMVISKNVNFGYAYALVDANKAQDFFKKAIDTPFNFDLSETALKYSEFAINSGRLPEYQNNPGEVLSNLDNSINLLKKVITQADNYPINWYRLANLYLVKDVYYGRGFSFEGLEAFNKAISLAPKRTEAKFLLAQANLLLGKPAEAKLLVQEILTADPKNSDARWQQAIFLKDEGKVNEALLIVEDLILKDYVFRSFSDIAWVAEGFEKQKKYQQAIGLYEKYLTSDPSNLPFMIDLVKVYKLAGEQNKALNLANAVLKLDSTKQKELEAILNVP